MRVSRLILLGCSWMPSSVIGLVAAVVLGLVPASAVGATPLEVADVGDAPLSSAGETAGVCESTDTTGSCTLRAAVQLANILSVEKTEDVTVSVPAGLFADVLGTLTVAEDAQVTLAGSAVAHSIIDDDKAGSVLTVERGGNLTVRDLTLRDGHAINGGAIDVPTVGSLVVERSALVDNSATGDGGAIYYSGLLAKAKHSVDPFASFGPPPEEPEEPGPSEDLLISQSTIAHNSAGGNGGGVYERRVVEKQAPTFKGNQMVNSTITDNEARAGGGIFAEDSLIELVADTISANRASSTAQANNLVAEGSEGKILLHATIIAEPTEAAGENCAGDIESGGYNLDDPSTPRAEPSEVDGCGLNAGEHDLLGLDPQLDPTGLKDNGGEAETLALLGAASGQQSPAIGAVPITECDRLLHVGEAQVQAVDQRGSERPGAPGEGCSIGAYEFSATTVTPTCTTPNPVSPGQQVTILCTIEKGAGRYATGTIARIGLPTGTALDSLTPSQGDCEQMTCLLGTIDPASVTIVLSPTVSGILSFTASDAETGAKQTSVRVSVIEGPVVAPTATAVAAAVVAVDPPPVRGCVSVRDFEIHLQYANRLGVVSATAYVDGVREPMRGRSLTAIVDLRGFPRGTVIVRIVAKTRTGTEITGRRTYHTCTTKLPSHKHLRL